MGTTSIGHAGETPQAITDYGTVRCQAGFGKGSRLCPYPLRCSSFRASELLLAFRRRTGLRACRGSVILTVNPFEEHMNPRSSSQSPECDSRRLSSAVTAALARRPGRPCDRKAQRTTR
jgi:hypothetical protein